MSYFKIIVPEEATNLFTDPRFSAADPDTAYDISGDGAAPDVTRVTTDQWIGDGCAQFDIDTGTQTTMKLDVSVSAVSYTMSMRVKRSGAGVVSNTEVQARFDSSNQNFDSITALRDNWYLCVITATATAGTREFGLQAKEDSLLSDGWQLEQAAYRTTYADGDMVGHRSDGYAWNGTVNNSTSTRHAQERSGGRVRDFEDDLSVKSVTSFAGYGPPDPVLAMQEYANVDGADFQDQKTPARLLDFGLTFLGASTISDLHTNQNSFFDAIQIDKVYPCQPFQFRYTGGSQILKMNCRYAGGLSGSTPQKMIEGATCRFVAPDPYWRGLGNQAAQLDVRDTDTGYYLALRKADGTWDNLGSGPNGTVRTIIRDKVGNILIGGEFTTVNGVTARRVAIYNITTQTWSELGDGFNNTCHALFQNSVNGKIYASGDFTADGAASTTLKRFAVIDSISDTDWAEFESGSTDGVGYAWAEDSIGDMYIGGSFTNFGGVYRRIIKYDISASTYAQVDNGLNNTVLDMVIDSNNVVYMVGDFTADGLGGGTIRRFAKISGSSITEVNNGLNATGRAIHKVSDTFLYIGGDFSANGAGSGTYNRLVRYDGDYTDLGSGLTAGTEDIYSLAMDAAGNLYVAGRDWTTIGSRTVTEGLSIYNGSEFQTVDISYSTVINYALNVWEPTSGEVELLVGGSVSTAAFAGNATLTNNGTSLKPILTLTGPGTVYSIVNQTTRTKLYFDDLTLASGEVLTVDLNNLTITSDLEGDLLSKLRSGSNLGDFGFASGDNIIYVFIDDATATGSTTWEELYDHVGAAA